MRILITGGHGFIGGRLAVYLSGNGHEIILGSRKGSVTPIWLPNATAKQINWSNQQSIQEACDGVDVVIHAAGMNAQDCAADPKAALEFNGYTTELLIKEAVNQNVKRFIYLSTVHAYANPLMGHFHEDSSTLNNHPYATSHVAGEIALINAIKQGKIEGAISRLSNVFGSPVDRNVNCWGLLTNDLCRQAILYKHLNLHTSGMQNRDFLSMQNACEMLTLLCTTSIEQTKPIFNIVNGKSMTVLSMAELIQHRCKILFHFNLEIKRPKSTENEKIEPLTLENIKIMSLGYEFNDREIQEIDNLLLFCKAHFAASQ
jgi:UDP-glucose 4-epimerase